MKLPKVFANDVRNLCDDVIQLMEAHNEIWIEDKLRFDRVANWLEKIGAHMAMVPETKQTTITGSRSQNVRAINA